jgi:hypothetical protein
VIVPWQPSHRSAFGEVILRKALILDRTAGEMTLAAHVNWAVEGRMGWCQTKSEEEPASPVSFWMQASWTSR